MDVLGGACIEMSDSSDIFSGLVETGVFEFEFDFEFGKDFWSKSERFSPWRTSRARWTSVGDDRLITPRVRWRLLSGLIAFSGIAANSR